MLFALFPVAFMYKEMSRPMKTTSKAVKKITRAYVLALSLIAVLLISGQAIVQLFLQGQAEDSKIVNISGRQGMLSQRLAKDALQIRYASTLKEREGYLYYFRKSFELFVLSHNNLTLQDNTLIEQMYNSPEVEKRYAELTPYYEKILDGGRWLMLSTTKKDSLEAQKFIEKGTQIILENERKFLPLMNNIVKTYETENAQSVIYLSHTEYVILSISLIILFLEIRFIFRPVTQYLDENDEIKMLNTKLRLANEELRSQKEELYQQAEELKSNNDFVEKVRQVAEEKNKELEAQAELMQRQHDRLESYTKKVNESIRYAERIQRAMFVRRKVIRDAFYDNFILFIPRDLVSGDFYWFKERKNRKIMAVVDCTGHGVPGAFMSLIGMDLIAHICAGKPLITPSEIIENLHEGIKRLLKQDQGRSPNRDGMDASICIYDKEKQTLEFAGAKQHLYYFRKQENTTELCIERGSVYPIGGGQLPDAKEKQRAYPMTVLDARTVFAFYMMSDGYVDQFGEKTARKFMIARFKEKLIEIHLLPMRKQQQILEKAYHDWKGNSPQIDDILVIGIRIQGKDKK